MSYWRYNSGSSIDALLEKEGGCTIEELFDDESLIQEIKVQNSTLIDFICEEKNLTEIISYITTVPPEGCDNKRLIKCPYMTNEIIGCENGIITEAILMTPPVISSLFAFLDDPKLGEAPETVCGPALLVPSYCSKALCIVFGKKPAESADIIRSYPNIISKIVARLVLPGVPDLLTRIVSIDSDTLSMANWACSNGLVECIVERIVNANNPDISEATAQALSDLLYCTTPQQAEVMGIVQPQVDSRSPIVARLQTKDVAGRLVGYALAPGGGLGAQKAAAVVVDILRQVSVESYDVTTPVAEMPGIVQVICEKLPECTNALVHGADSLGDVKEEFYVLSRPLGTFRLSVVEILEALISTNLVLAAEKVVQSPGLLPTLVGLFFEYKWNTFLHQAAFNIIMSLLKMPVKDAKKVLLDDPDGGVAAAAENGENSNNSIKNMDETKKNNFADSVSCGIVNRILKAETLNKEHVEKTGLSLGYISFLTKIATLLNSLALEERTKDLSPAPVSEAIGRLPSWKAYSEGVLAERSAREVGRLGGDSVGGGGDDDSEDEGDAPGFGNDPNGFFSTFKGVFDEGGQSQQQGGEEEDEVEDGDVGENFFGGAPYQGIKMFAVEEAPFKFEMFDGPIDENEFDEDKEFDDDDPINNSDDEEEDDDEDDEEDEDEEDEDEDEDEDEISGKGKKVINESDDEEDEDDEDDDEEEDDD